MLRRRFLVPLAALLALAVAVPVFFGGGSHAQSEAGVVAFENPAPSASAELRLWQSVRDPLGGIWLSARPDADSSWTTSRLHLAMIEGGGWRVANHTVDAPGGEIEVRLWQDPGALRLLYLSARPHGASWNEYGTQRIRLDERSRSGRYRYGDVSVALEWPDAEPPPPETARDALCIPEDLWRAGAELRLWRSVATPHRYYLSARPDTESSWTTRRLTLEESDVEGWNTATATALAGLIVEEAEEDAASAGGDEDRADGEEDADDGDAPAPAFELRLWQRGNALALSARVAGTTWDEYGTQSVTLNRRSASGNFTYADRVITLTLPESEPPLPGATRTWDCPGTTPGGGGGGGGTTPGTGAGTGEAEATPTPDPDNRAPWADAGDDQTVAVGDTVTLDGSGSADVDEDEITYAWTQTGGSYTGAVALTGANTASPTFTVDAALNGQTVEFTLTVTDEHGLTKTDAVMITVLQQQQGGGAPPPGGGLPPGGSPAPSPTLNVSNITETGATLTITNHTAQWWYKESADTTCEGPVAVNTATKVLTGLTEGPSYTYTYSAYSDSGCSALLATAAAFTTSLRLESSVAATHATLDIVGHTGDWHYQADKGPHTSCSGAVTSNSANLTGLSPSTSYTYSAYSDPGCSALLATAAFTTFAQLTASNVTATTATLTIDGHSGDWWYKSATTGKTTCTSARAASSANVTGLTHNTTYAFTAYSDDTCLAPLGWADEFTTLTPTLESSNETATGATLTLGDWTIAKDGSWYYQYTSPTGGTCSGPQSELTATVSLSPGTAYVFTAYSDACSTALATASQFTTPVQLTAGSITATGATLTLAGHSGQWWYKADANPHKTCQGPVAAGTTSANPTGLTEGTSYTYSAYSNNGCSTLLATANKFTTGISLSAGNVTATTVTLTLAGYSEKWWYKKRVDTACRGSVAAGTDTTTLTGLTPGEPYTWTVHSDSSCRTELARTWFTMSAPALTSSNVTDNSATLTLRNDWTTADGKWHYKSETTGKTTCVEGATGSTEATQVDVTELTPGMSYTFTAYTNSGCTTVIDAAPAFTTPSLTTSELTATTVKLTIAGHTGDWSYKSATTGHTACTAVTAGTSSVYPVGLGKGTKYTFTAYSDSNCTAANRLATAAEFTTLSPALTSSVITKYSAKLTLSNWESRDDGEWYYKSATIGKRDCTSPFPFDYESDDGLVTRDTATGLAPNTAYVFTAYTDNACTAGKEIVAAPSFTTTANTAPVVIFSNANVTAGNSHTLSATVTDDEAVSALTWQWTVPAATVTGATTATPSVAIPAGAPVNSTYQPTVTVRDAEGGTTTASAILTVNNRAPTAVLSGAPYSAPANRQINVSGLSSRDPDTDVLSYSWAKTGGTYTGAVSFGGGTTYPSTHFTIPSNATTDQTIVITLTVNDGKGGTDTDSATVTVGPWSTNWPPTANAGLDQNFKMGQNANNRVTITGSGSDPDTNDTLSYSWAVASSLYKQYVTLVQNPSKPQEVYFDWPSQAPLNAKIQIDLTVCDNHNACNTDEMIVTRILGLTVDVGADGDDLRRRSDATAVTFTPLTAATVSNPDGLTVTLDWEVVLNDNADPGVLPKGVTISGEATTAITVTFAGEDAPTSAAAGTYSIGLTATPSGLQGTTPPVDWLTVELVANQAPTVTSIGVSGRNLDGNATDPDGPDTALVHTWNAPANSGITFSTNDTTSDQTTINGPSGTYTIKLRVTDQHGGTGERTVSVTIP